MNITVCSKCGTENEEDFIYCKNCGYPLKINSSTPPTNTTPNVEYSSPQPQPQHNSNGAYSQPAQPYINSIQGISNEEVAIFIGKKAHDIIPKFTKMELTGSKVSWCWPLAVLSFFFGPLGASLWFFYRKMYKPAVIFAIIGAVFTLVSSLFTAFIDTSALETILENYMNGDFAAAITAFESIDATSIILLLISQFVTNAVTIASFIVCGIFGYHWYKQHCLDKIRYYRTIQADQRYYRFGLSAIGGVSGGMLTLGIILMLIINSSTEMIFTVFSML